MIEREYTVTTKILDSWMTLGVPHIIQIFSITPYLSEATDIEVDYEKGRIRRRYDELPIGPYTFHLSWADYSDDEEAWLEALDLSRQQIINYLKNSPLKGKTVLEIRTAVQNQIAAWGNLGDAKTDLGEWLPDLIAALLWLLVGEIMRPE